MIQLDWNFIFMQIFAFVLCITVHEFAHAVTAYKLGDPTPKRQGRVTLNPLDHLDPLGTLMLVLMVITGARGIGWGRAVQVNPANFEHPRRDLMLVAAAGPFSNLLLALLIAGLLRLQILPMTPSLAEFLVMMVYMNIGLMFFNLIPIAPLDGSKILAGLLPADAAYRYEMAMFRFGPILLLALVFIVPGVLSVLVGMPTAMLASRLLGMGM
ncbi:MAG: site-2 protease family protein [Armatimonadota bacterium]|nr:site-2 protease family protein [bacterium]MDW8104431.1 site-2 protease family protein [Armatimonadota bacterium]MDW8289696.1 site-2 protease family protein [Armatimonadota bacterium]